ncbi:MAG: hypothetical protein HYV42_01670 [Candidatus Magasanikbacteria bacterium]|nr:hypothetical protein [Candidatus Magasanikbacteria bacterium]
MKFFHSLFLLTPILLAFFIGAVSPATAAADYCFCGPKDVSQFAAQKLADQMPPAICARLDTNLTAVDCEAQKASPDKGIYRCELRETEANCQASVDAVNAQLGRQQGRYKVLGIVIPSCLFEPVLPRECRDISLFVELLINFGSATFTIVGAFALAFFIYGGFNLIIAQGNPEKIKKGGDAMLAAVIGLVIVFAGYLLIRFLGEAVGVKEFYQLPR